MRDVQVIGHVTRDRLDPPLRSGRDAADGQRADGSGRAGGTATYFALAYARLGGEVGVFTRMAPEDEAELLAESRAAGIEIVTAASPKTTEFRNRYRGDEREQQVGAVALPFVPADLEGLSARVFHLGPLTRDDMPVELIEAASERGRVSLDAQGLVRRIERGRVELCDWPDRARGLACVSFLKADEDEARVLSGESDPEQAARTIASFGPEEVLVTRAGRGAWVLHPGGLDAVPAFATPDAVDPTGCGDTFMAGYLFARRGGEDPVSAARFGAAAAARKLRRVGPFDEDVAAVRQLL